MVLGARRTLADMAYADMALVDMLLGWTEYHRWKAKAETHYLVGRTGTIRQLHIVALYLVVYIQVYIVYIYIYIYTYLFIYIYICIGWRGALPPGPLQWLLQPQPLRRLAWLMLSWCTHPTNLG